VVLKFTFLNKGNMSRLCRREREKRAKITKVLRGKKKDEISLSVRRSEKQSKNAALRKEKKVGFGRKL